MKLSKKLTPIAAGSALLLSGLVPMASQADVSSSATISSMYLWRGIDISDNKPAMSGDISYSHESGLYASFWMSSEGSTERSTTITSCDASETTGDPDCTPSDPANVTIPGSNSGSLETDWTIGYSGSAGDVDYDVGYYKFFYPESGQKFSDAGAEIYVDVSFKGYGVKAYLDAKGDKTYKYYTVYGGYGPFTGTLGINAADGTAGDYDHLDVSYAATDRLSFTYSKSFKLGDGNGMATNPIYMLSYSLPVDLK